MKQKYFVNSFYLPSGLSVMESRLADLARASMHCVYDRPSLEAYADYLQKQQDLFYSQNRRAKPVEISVDFHDNLPSRDVTFRMGRMWIPVLKVEKEILAGGAG